MPEQSSKKNTKKYTYPGIKICEFGLEHEVAALIEALAKKEASRLMIGDRAFTTSDYLIQLIQREATKELTEQERAEAKDLQSRREQGASSPLDALERS
ncbi:MAG: hypothetical protein E6J34_23445 [Chloroflexi bacterium]|nr:MAG: hypothetical protein E6J34_23445 [Chloroflexota bacterium]